jgi:anaerobic sulfite reductase subunit B
MSNKYIPFSSKVVDIIKHTEHEYTFRMAYNGDVTPGQFFEVSIPKYGEAPISVSGIGKGTIDFTVRKVGRVTNELFELTDNATLLLRGPYGNGFDPGLFKGKELFVIAGGTGVSPVRGVVEYFAAHPGECSCCTLIAGFRTPHDILFRDDLAAWEHAPGVRLILTTDDNCGDASYKQGLVTVYIPDLEVKDIATAQAIVVGPPAMMRFSLKGLLEKGFAEKNIWVSHERKMCCGLGKCGHCKINDKYVCQNGPVFNYSDAKDFVD